MADDDDWETDADFENNLTEAEQRAYGNRETMDKYNAVMDKAGGSIPGASMQSSAPAAKAAAPPLVEPTPEPVAAATPARPTPGKLPTSTFQAVDVSDSAVPAPPPVKPLTTKTPVSYTHLTLPTICSV